ncbi:MAG TPA: hypothetical protein ENK52_06855 [Saprospiraceae bacterium]|nr:hypothetical protein [Saprospiraceae bacterium]
MKSNENIRMIIIACMTLGLAPFFPEPHILGKLRWVAGGAHGMKLIDWGDFLLHGFPWFLLIVYLLKMVYNKIQNNSTVVKNN